MEHSVEQEASDTAFFFFFLSFTDVWDGMTFKDRLAQNLFINLLIWSLHERPRLYITTHAKVKSFN